MKKTTFPRKIAYAAQILDVAVHAEKINRTPVISIKRQNSDLVGSFQETPSSFEKRKEKTRLLFPRPIIFVWNFFWHSRSKQGSSLKMILSIELQNSDLEECF